MVEFDEKAFLAKIQAEKQEQESRRPNDPFRLLISLCVVGGIFYLIYLGVSASSRETQELQSIWKNGLRSQATVIYFREREVKVSGRNRFSKETKKLKDIFVELRLPNGTKVKAQLGRGKNEDYNRGDTLTVVYLREQFDVKREPEISPFQAGTMQNYMVKNQVVFSEKSLARRAGI